MFPSLLNAIFPLAPGNAAMAGVAERTKLAAITAHAAVKLQARLNIDALMADRNRAPQRYPVVGTNGGPARLRRGAGA
jgi:hypothetical protein